MKAVIRLDVPDFQIGEPATVYFRDTMMKHGTCSKDDVVYCKDCKHSCYYCQRFSNQYVCTKNADKYGRIPEHDLKGHHGYWFCADGERKDDF